MKEKPAAGCWLLAQFLVTGMGLGAESWTAPAVRIPHPDRHPLIACTPEELARLQTACNGSGPAHDVVVAAVKAADKFLDDPITFPPRGGQHNQWYQCDKCELALETVSDTQHRCPKCGKIYTGEPYDDVVFKRYHSRNFSQMRQAAWAYAITGRRKYADYTAKILLGYADRYLRYPYHTNSAAKQPKGLSGGHIDEQTLGEATILSRQIAPAYDLIHDSPALSGADHKAIEEQLILPMLKNIDKYKAGKSNWQTWHNAAMLWGGAVIGDESWIRKAIEQPGQGFAFQMGACLSEEGMWYENSWGYHFYTLDALVETCEGARRLGIDLWGHPNLKKMFLLPIRYAMPDGSLPRFGDDVNASIQRIGPLGEPAYMVYREPLLLPYLLKTPTIHSIMLGRQLETLTSEHKPSFASEIMPSAGHAILRTQGPAALTAAFTFSPYGGGHGHYDKLSFVLFGYQRELAVDPGRAASQAYRLPIHKQWYKATISHNTVVVDGQSQEPVAGRLRLFASNERYAAVVADCDTAYRGVAHRRMLVMTPTYLLVYDRLDSTDQERRFDWFYHNRGHRVWCEAAGGPVDLSAEPAGYQYIQQATGGMSTGAARIVFLDDPVATYLTVAGNGPMEAVVGDGPGSSILERVPLAMIRQTGRGARVVAVIEPVVGAAKPSVTSVVWQEENGGATVEVVSGPAVESVRLAGDLGIEIRSGHKTVLASQPSGG
ncbi:MAG: alginate lyase family protein [Phycisphaerae bacterium]